MEGRPMFLIYTRAGYEALVVLLMATAAVLAQ
jgi:hypothetical protein